MNTITKRLPSPAMLVACIALVIALGGVSYAAAVLPKNSVGTAQLKNRAVTAAKLGKNAVTGARVKDRTLMAADFKADQLPAGPQGPKGDPGAPGQPGPKGDQGEPGIAFMGSSLMEQPVEPTPDSGHSRSVTLERASRLLVHGVVKDSSFTCAAGSPTCKVQIVPIIDGVTQPTTVPALMIVQGGTSSFGPGRELLAVTAEVPAGKHYVGISVVRTGQFTSSSRLWGPLEVLAVG